MAVYSQVYESSGMIESINALKKYVICLVNAQPNNNNYR